MTATTGDSSGTEHIALPYVLMKRGLYYRGKYIRAERRWSFAGYTANVHEAAHINRRRAEEYAEPEAGVTYRQLTAQEFLIKPGMVFVPGHDHDFSPLTIADEKIVYNAKFGHWGEYHGEEYLDEGDIILDAKVAR